MNDAAQYEYRTSTTTVLAGSAESVGCCLSIEPSLRHDSVCAKLWRETISNM
jgi:hypothetical protein